MPAKKRTQEFQRHIERADRAYDKGQYEQAIAELKVAYELDPLPDVLFNLAQTCRKAGFERDALPLYDRVAKEAPDALLREPAKRYALEIRNRLAQLEADRAGLLVEKKEYDQAVAALEAAYRIHPAPLLVYRIGQAQRLAGRTSEAVVAYERFVAEDPRSELRSEVEGHLVGLRARLEEDRGARLFADKRYAEAASAWEAAHRGEPRPALLFRIGQAKRLAGREEDARAAYQKFVDSKPGPDLAKEVEEASGHLPRQPLPEVVKRERAAGMPPLSAGLLAQKWAQRPVERRTPVYKRWWFWTVLGGVVAAGAVTGAVAGILSQPEDPLRGVPEDNIRGVGP